MHISGAYTEKMRSEYKLVIINIILACASFSFGVWFAPHVHAETPVLPNLPFQLYGVVTDSTGVPIPNARIDAFIKGEIIASTKSDEKGNYGIAPNVMLISDTKGEFTNKYLTLQANGIEITHEILFEAGGLENVPLIITKASIFPKEGIISSSSIKTMSESSSSTPLIVNSANPSVSKFPPSDSLVFGLSTSTPVPAKYRGDILHLQKDHARYYKTVNPSYYEPTGILGTSAGILVIILLSWVFYQNFRHARKKR